MSRATTYREAVREALFQEMERDPKVFLYGLDVTDHRGIFGSTLGLVERFGPERCFATPLAEDAMTGFALGAALAGRRPIHVHQRADFLLLGMNQLANMLSCARYVSGGRVKVPVTIRAVIGRGWGQACQHSKSMHGVFAHIPGLKVACPSTPADAKLLLAAAIRDDNPVVVLEHRSLYDVAGSVPEGDQTGTLGRAAVLRPGGDISVTAVSWMAIEAVKAAEVLQEFHGVGLEVVDPRSIAPLDRETISASAAKTGRMIVADCDWSFCGFAAEVAAGVAEDCFGKLLAPVRRLGFAHSPCPTARHLENAFYPGAPQIIRAVEDMLGLEPADLSGQYFYSYENKFKGPF